MPRQAKEAIMSGTRIEQAVPAEAADIAVMVGELLDEIVDAIGQQAFNFELAETTRRLERFLREEKYFVFLAKRPEGAAGFIALSESHALYAEGDFGTIPELYVRPAYRSMGTGEALLNAARKFAAGKGWTRLEVTTPPLPEFERTLRFYEKQGFAVTGGRKLKLGLS
jgi:GNAT superfamily N-acetyltransferase